MPAFYSTTGRTILCYACFRVSSAVRTGSSQFKGNLFSRRRTKRPQTRGSLCGILIHVHPFSISFHFFQTQSPTFSLRFFELRGGASSSSSPSPFPPPPERPILDRYIQEIKRLIFDSVWARKPTNVERNTLIGKRKYGGLKMCDFKII